MRSSRAIASALLTAVLLVGCAGTSPSGVPNTASSMSTSATSPHTTSLPPSTGTTTSAPTTGTRASSTSASQRPTGATTSRTTGTSTSATRTSSSTTTSHRTTTSQTTTTHPTRTTTTSAARPAQLQVGHSAWVSVSVATLWRSPSSPRAVDQPALGNPAAIRQWLSAMTLTDRRGLTGRADTQALLGERVLVTALSGSWAKVVVPDQPTPLDGRGYPGWVPTRQLTATSPVASSLTATVVTPTAWLRTDDASASAVVEVSYGTRLPRVGATESWVRVVAPSGRVLRVGASLVSLTAPGAPAVAASGSELVRSAQMFTGLPYLWAGTSGFGLDCSGLTSLVYRVHGVVIPRDADAQAVRGVRVASTALRPGDLLFYATNGYVHHVSMYAGHSLMVQAPHTGAVVETIPMSTAAYAVEFAGARRYLG